MTDARANLPRNLTIYPTYTTMVLTPERSKTMQVIWCVFQISLSAIVILHTVHNDRLKPSPTHGDDQRIIRLQFSIIPAMMF